MLNSICIPTLLVLLSILSYSLGAPCSCTSKEHVPVPSSPAEATVEEFKIHVEENGARYDEVVKIDVAKNTETIHVPAYNNMDEGDIIHDFNKNLTMIRLPERESCYLSQIYQNIPAPDKLLGLMETMGNSIERQDKKTVYTGWRIQGPLTDRRTLSEEMAGLCARYPIYRTVRQRDSVSVEKESYGQPHRRPRRGNNACGELCTQYIVFRLHCPQSGSCYWTSQWQTSCSTIFC